MKIRTLIIIILVLVLGAGVYAYFYLLSGSNNTPATTPTTNDQVGFSPFERPGSNVGNGNTGGSFGGNSGNNSGNATTTFATSSQTSFPVLRILSSTPVGGYNASTTASTTVIRWVDRGRGNIYEANYIDENIKILSNTVLPRIYQSVWNKNLTAFVGTMLEDNITPPSSVYAELKLRPVPKTATTTAANTPNVSDITKAPYDLKGSNLPKGVIAYAASPKGDKIFILIGDSGGSTGYISTFDGKTMTKLFTTPLTALKAEWPEDSNIAITTLGNASQLGYTYLVNTKTGVWKKIIGPLLGLSATVSHDAKYAISSYTGSSGPGTRMYRLSDGSKVDASIRTIADKCTWGNFYKEMVYCAVPRNLAGNLPDDWYEGNVSFSDDIWQINITSGEVKLAAELNPGSGTNIDAYKLSTDPKDNYLFFINKNDLSLWSLDLISAN